MNANLFELHQDIQDKDKYIIACQYCGSGRVMKRRESGADIKDSGHYEFNCPEKEKDNDSIIEFLSSPFGIIVPDKNHDVLWTVQTNGLMCSQRYIRGVYIPVNSPIISRTDIENLDSYDENLFKEEDYITVNGLKYITSLNYKMNTQDGDVYTDLLEQIWCLIENELPFEFNECESPDYYQSSEEAWKWIQITKSNESSISDVNYSPLVGERVLLVYPNSD